MWWVCSKSDRLNSVQQVHVCEAFGGLFMELGEETLGICEVYSQMLCVCGRYEPWSSVCTMERANCFFQLKQG